MNNKIEGLVSFIVRDIKYKADPTVKYTDRVKTRKIKTLCVFKGNVHIACIFKHPCKEVTMFVCGGITLTLDTMERHIIPMMKQYDTHKKNKFPVCVGL